jgi:transcriptional regulator with XRE-family HTH domain
VANPLALTPDQCRRAREVLGCSKKRLAGLTGMREETITNFETRRSSATLGTMLTLRRVLQEAGVEFEAEGGVRLRERQVS